MTNSYTVVTICFISCILHARTREIEQEVCRRTYIPCSSVHLTESNYIDIVQAHIHRYMIIYRCCLSIAVDSSHSQSIHW